jgi:hypothetical protein
MAENESRNDKMPSEEVEQTAGMETAKVNADAKLSLERGRNASKGKGKNAAGGTAPRNAKDYVPSRSDPKPSNLPSSDHALPDNADDANEEAITASSKSGGEKGDRYTH